MKMRGGVLLYVHRIYGDLRKRDSLPVHLKQHLGLIFIALTADFCHKRKQGGRNRSQPGLGIRDTDAAGKTEYPLGNIVAHPAPGRNIRLAEVSAAQDNTVLICLCYHFIAAGPDIPGSVLAITVHRNHTIDILAVLDTVLKSRFHCSSLTLIHLMANQGYPGKLPHLNKGLIVSLITAVIYDKNVIKPFFCQSFYRGNQFFIGIIGWYNHANPHLIFPRKISFAFSS